MPPARNFFSFEGFARFGEGWRRALEGFAKFGEA
jgi:hypothetical protein